MLVAFRGFAGLVEELVFRVEQLRQLQPNRRAVRSILRQQTWARSELSKNAMLRGEKWTSTTKSAPATISHLIPGFGIDGGEGLIPADRSQAAVHRPTYTDGAAAEQLSHRRVEIEA